MEFLIKIDPAKRKDFLQIMEVLQRLQVVWEMDPTTEAAPEKEPQKDKSSREVASQYRDLVD